MTDGPEGYEHWSRFWRSGALTSLSDDFAANYEGELAGFWNSIFSTLPNKAAVLDICTGNGAIALLAAQARSDLRIQALDASAIDTAAVAARFPQYAAHVDRIHFHTGCRIEDWRAPEAAFDLLCSQYGIEYTDWHVSARAIYRCLKPGGKFALVAHSPDSEMVRVMRQEAQVYDYLSSVALLGQLDSFAQGKLDVTQFRQGLGDIASRLARTTTELREQALMRQVQSVVAHLSALDAPVLDQERENAGIYLAELLAGQARLFDMLNVNERLLNEPEWFRCFGKAGLELLSNQMLYYRSHHPCGQALVFRRPNEC